MTTKLQNADRLRDLERKISAAESLLSIIEERKDRAPVFRMAKVVENTAAGSVAKCVFVNMEHDGGFDQSGHQNGTVTKKDRSNEQTVQISYPFDIKMPKGMVWPAYQAGPNDQWFFVAVGMARAKTLEPIPANGSASGLVEIHDGEDQPTGCQIPAYSFDGLIADLECFVFFDIWGKVWACGCEEGDNDPGDPTEPPEGVCRDHRLLFIFWDAARGPSSSTNPADPSASGFQSWEGGGNDQRTIDVPISYNDTTGEGSVTVQVPGITQFDYDQSYDLTCNFHCGVTSSNVSVVSGVNAVGPGGNFGIAGEQIRYESDGPLNGDFQLPWAPNSSIVGGDGPWRGGFIFLYAYEASQYVGKNRDKFPFAKISIACDSVQIDEIVGMVYQGTAGNGQIIYGNDGRGISQTAMTPGAFFNPFDLRTNGGSLLTSQDFPSNNFFSSWRTSMPFPEDNNVRVPPGTAPAGFQDNFAIRNGITINPQVPIDFEGGVGINIALTRTWTYPRLENGVFNTWMNGTPNQSESVSIQYEVKLVTSGRLDKDNPTQALIVDEITLNRASIGGTTFQDNITGFVDSIFPGEFGLPGITGSITGLRRPE